MNYSLIWKRNFISILLLFAALPAGAQKPFSVREVMSAPHPTHLVSAKKTDRIAWVVYEEGLRNIYTAIGPRFDPRRLTSYEEQDGQRPGANGKPRLVARQQASGLRQRPAGSSLCRGHRPRNTQNHLDGPQRGARRKPCLVARRERNCIFSPPRRGVLRPCTLSLWRAFHRLDRSCGYRRRPPSLGSKSGRANACLDTKLPVGR